MVNADVHVINVIIVKVEDIRDVKITRGQVLFTAFDIYGIQQMLFPECF